MINIFIITTTTICNYDTPKFLFKTCSGAGAGAGGSTHSTGSTHCMHALI